MADLQQRREVYLAFCLKPPAKMFVCSQKKERKWALLLSLFFFFSKQIGEKIWWVQVLQMSLFLEAARHSDFPITKVKRTPLISNHHSKLKLSNVFFFPKRNRIQLNNLIHYNFYCLSLRTRRPSTLVTPAVTSAPPRQMWASARKVQTARYFSESSVFKCDFVFVHFVI